MSYFLMLGEFCVNVSDVSQIALKPITNKTNKDEAFAVTTYRAVLTKNDRSDTVLMQSEDRAQVLGFIDESCRKLNFAIDS